MHHNPPIFEVLSKHVTGIPRSFSALMTGSPLAPAPTTQTVGSVPTISSPLLRARNTIVNLFRNRWVLDDNERNLLRHQPRITQNCLDGPMPPSIRKSSAPL